MTIAHLSDEQSDAAHEIKSDSFSRFPEFGPRNQRDGPKLKGLLKRSLNSEKPLNLPNSLH